MRPAFKTAIGIGVVIVLIVIAILGWRAATRTPEPPAPSPSSSTAPSEGQPSPPATPSEPTESAAPDGDVPDTATGVDALVRKIPDRQWRRIVSTGTWRPGCPVGRSDLRRIELNYRTFDGGVERGQLIAHQDSVDDLVEIFAALFEEGFPIERMKPVERYGGEVLRSLEANNTSAFNCRKPGQINAPVTGLPARERPRDRHQPRPEPLARPTLRLLAARPRVREGQGRPRSHPQGLPAGAAVRGAWLDLAEHQGARLHALRHRLPVTTQDRGTGSGRRVVVTTPHRAELPPCVRRPTRVSRPAPMELPPLRPDSGGTVAPRGRTTQRDADSRSVAVRPMRRPVRSDR